MNISRAHVAGVAVTAVGVDATAVAAARQVNDEENFLNRNETSNNEATRKK